MFSANHWQLAGRNFHDDQRSMIFKRPGPSHYWSVHPGFLDVAIYPLVICLHMENDHRNS